jgi:hypothetical protein
MRPLCTVVTIVFNTEKVLVKNPGINSNISLPQHSFAFILCILSKYATKRNRHNFSNKKIDSTLSKHIKHDT